jgi:hypothetical protein
MKITEFQSMLEELKKLNFNDSHLNFLIIEAENTINSYTPLHLTAKGDYYKGQIEILIPVIKHYLNHIPIKEK